MKIINRRILTEYWEEHPDARIPLQTWFHMTRHANWSRAVELRAVFPGASFINQNWVIFDLKAVPCQLVACVFFQHGLVYLRHIRVRPQGVNPGEAGHR